MTESLYIRLAGPLQSWAGSAVTGNIVRTGRYPTRTALHGLLGGALGAKRGELPQWLNTVEFWVRPDRTPTITDDFHTINPRPEAAEFRRRLLLAMGMPARGAKALVFTPDAQNKTSVVRRTYLADGEFIVRITALEHIDELERALAAPAFATYLGRKAFPATFPFYLGRGDAEAFAHIPLPPSPAKKQNTWKEPGESSPSTEQKSKEIRFWMYHSGMLVPQPAQRSFPVARTEPERLRTISELLRIER